MTEVHIPVSMLFRKTGIAFSSDRQFFFPPPKDSSDNFSNALSRSSFDLKYIDIPPLANLKAAVTVISFGTL